MIRQRGDELPDPHNFAAEFAREPHRSDLASDLIEVHIMSAKGIMRTIRNVNRSLSKVCEAFEERPIRDNGFKLMIGNARKLPCRTNIEKFAPRAAERIAGQRA